MEQNENNLKKTDTVSEETVEAVSTAEADEIEALPEKVDVIGVKFRQSAKVYYFEPNGLTPKVNEHVIVETARGLEYGTVALELTSVSASNIVSPLRKAIRIATPADDQKMKDNLKKGEDAFDICLDKIAEHRLEMKLIDAEYTFDNNKLLFYFTADGRVDFRDLVKDLASVFRTRIELRQIGIRDEAKCMGGLGVCGRPFCCKTFLPDFTQVSIKMAKEQNLSLNSSKISGTCGRLMCCLRYEAEAYDYEIRRTPKVDSIVSTPDGNGKVTEVSPLVGMVKVKLESAPDSPPKSYHRDTLKVLELPKKGKKRDNSDDELKKLED
ncbi:MAG: stage 0 sporulation family protein [Clostridia bacterium]|nr:stage 0 sporulation family protein [Clostridia bacterium]